MIMLYIQEKGLNPGSVGKILYVQNKKVKLQKDAKYTRFQVENLTSKYINS